MPYVHTAHAQIRFWRLRPSDAFEQEATNKISKFKDQTIQTLVATGNNQMASHMLSDQGATQATSFATLTGCCRCPWDRNRSRTRGCVCAMLPFSLGRTSWWRAHFQTSDHDAHAEQTEWFQIPTFVGFVAANLSLVFGFKALTVNTFDEVWSPLFVQHTANQSTYLPSLLVGRLVEHIAPRQGKQAPALEYNNKSRIVHR